MNTSNITNYKPKDFAELLGVSVINAPLHTGLFTPVFKSFCPVIHGRSGNPDVKSRLVYASRNPLKPIVDLMLKKPRLQLGILIVKRYLLLMSHLPCEFCAKRGHTVQKEKPGTLSMRV